MPKAKEWSDEELKILRSIWKSEYTVKERIHLLPGRSLIAIKCAAFVHKLPKKKRGFVSWVRPAVIATLKKAPGLTGREICVAVGCGYTQAMFILKQLNEDPRKKVFVASWCRSGTLWVQRWKLGASKDAPKPARQDPNERRRLDRIYRRRSTQGFNPFAVAAGLVSAPVGRTFSQSVGIRESEAS